VLFCAAGGRAAAAAASGLGSLRPAAGETAEPRGPAAEAGAGPGQRWAGPGAEATVSQCSGGCCGKY